jgi:hypothetical protein
MRRQALAAVVVGLGVALLASGTPEAARAEPAAAMAAAPEAAATDLSAQSRRAVRRAPRRVPIYRGSHYPGPNAVRLCHAYYEQEYRPSGTVIVPRMRCHWSG